METFAVQPVGRVRSPRHEPVDDNWRRIDAVIELESRFGPDAVRGLQEFSHIEVVYIFHLVDPADVSTAARRPRGNAAWPEVGIFAQRAKDRPNRVGVSICELLAVEHPCLRVRGLDAVDGTPVIDIKPFIGQFAPHGPVRQPTWADELMSDYF